MKNKYLIIILVLGFSAAAYLTYFSQVIEPKQQSAKEQQLIEEFRDITQIFANPDRDDGPIALQGAGSTGGWSNEAHVFIRDMAKLEVLDAGKELDVIRNHVISGLRADALMLHLAANGQLSSAKLADLSFDAEEAYLKASLKAKRFMDSHDLDRKQGFDVWFGDQIDYRWEPQHFHTRERD